MDLQMIILNPGITQQKVKKTSDEDEKNDTFMVQKKSKYICIDTTDFR